MPRLSLLAAVLMFASAPAGAAGPAEELAAAPARWPAEVTVTRATRAEVLKAGQPAGTMLLGAGRVLAVLALTPERLTGRIGATEVVVPLDHTDALARASATPAPAQAPMTAQPASAAPVRSAPAERPIPAVPPTPLQTALNGKLVMVQDGAVRPFDARRLNGVQFYALYFSAAWCGPCREFTPELVRDYAALKQLYPEFELVFVSWDHTEPEMHAYLRDGAMPWPALRHADRRLRDVFRHAGNAIPCLVLVDASGRELSHSFRRGRYVGPAQVVEETWKILKEHRRARAGK